MWLCALLSSSGKAGTCGTAWIWDVAPHWEGPSRQPEYLPTGLVLDFWVLNSVEEPLNVNTKKGLLKSKQLHSDCLQPREGLSTLLEAAVLGVRVGVPALLIPVYTRTTLQLAKMLKGTPVLASECEYSPSIRQACTAGETWHNKSRKR